MCIWNRTWYLQKKNHLLRYFFSYTDYKILNISPPPNILESNTVPVLHPVKYHHTHCLELAVVSILCLFYPFLLASCLKMVLLSNATNFENQNSLPFTLIVNRTRICNNLLLGWQQQIIHKDALKMQKQQYESWDLKLQSWSHPSDHAI